MPDNSRPWSDARRLVVTRVRRHRRRLLGVTLLAVAVSWGAAMTGPLWPPLLGWLGRWWPVVAVAVLALSALTLLTPRRSDEERDEERRLAVQPLSVRAIVLGSLVLLAVGVTAAALLLYRYGGSEDAATQLDALRTAGTLLLGTGGAAALLLTARRTRSGEQTVHLQQATYRSTTQHALNQQITDAYTKAGAPRGALSYPRRSREELKGGSWA